MAKHKPKIMYWFRISCPCGWHSDMVRSGSQGKREAYAQYREHKHPGSKVKPTGWVVIGCDCGFRSDRWRSDSAGLSSAWSDYRRHKEGRD